MAASVAGRRVVVGELSSWRCRGEQPNWRQWRKVEEMVELGREGEARVEGG